MAKLKIGLALGSGAARGWAHIGVLRVLSEAGVEPDIICGTSVGAVVGAAYLTGQLDALQSWARSLRLLGVLGLLDITFSHGGLLAVDKTFERFRTPRTDVPLSALPKTFGAVATDLATGREIWLREGNLLDVVRASAAMPGLFPAARLNDLWLVDGALVNPVPVSLCRALGADVVIAVNLNSDLATLPRFSGSDPPETGPRAPAPEVEAPDGLIASLTSQLSARLGGALGDRTRLLAAQILGDRDRQRGPSVLEILAGSIDIMQDRITRSRLAGEPPDVLIEPRLGQIGILDFDRGDELIAIGAATAASLRPAIELAIRRR